MNKLELLDKILELRHIDTIISNFIDVDISDDSRIHTSFSLVETGRLSSHEDEVGKGTHLQNVPGPTAPEEESESFHVNVRRMFVADEGKILIEADKKQGENRILAYLAEEDKMKEAFKQGVDIHSFNARNIFGVREPSKVQRLYAKKRTHGWDYGLGARTNEEREAKAKYFRAYPKIELWQKRIVEEVNKKRVLTNPFGRRRVFFARKGPQLWQEAYAFLPQSTLVDDVNRSMIQIFYAAEPKLQLLHQGHDSLLFQIFQSQLEWAIDIIKQNFEIPFLCGGDILTIPVEIKTGLNWGEMKEVK